MSAELDPMFVRALHLLHSRHPKSLEQLCALRDEALGKKPGSPVEGNYMISAKKDPVIDPTQYEQSHDIVPSGIVPELTKIEQVDDVVKDSSSSKTSLLHDDKSDITETIEVDSSSLSTNALVCPDDDMVETVEEFGSSFLETLEELGSSDLLLSKTKKPKMDAVSVGKTMIDQIDVASRESSPDRETSPDLGIHCIICASAKNSMIGNQIVECHECHEHYHQNCHKPNITDQNINDPRHVWYCSRCVKRMKEATSTSTTTTKPKPLIITSGLSFKSQTQSFKPPVRVDGKPPSFSPGSSSVNQSFSIPSLNTNTNSNNSNNLKSPSNANPRDVTRNSMKRLQMVKKKAAAKNQQRFMKK